MRNHRTKDRREPFRCGGFGGVARFSVTLQNNLLGWIDIEPDCVALPDIKCPDNPRSTLGFEVKYPSKTNIALGRAIAIVISIVHGRGVYNQQY
jgi:hypothetical protein